MTLAAVVLAAGASTRLGEPKALARIGDRSVLEHLLGAIDGLVSAGRPLVVTGAHHDEIVAFVESRSLDVEIERNVGWAEGRTGSVARAARARPGEDLLLCPVDVPLVGTDALVALEHAWTAAGEPASGWAAPFVAAPGTVPNRDESERPQRRFGHPVLVGRELVRSAAALGPDSPLRALRDVAEPLLAVATVDPAILDDLDTPEHLERLRRRAAGATKR